MRKKAFGMLPGYLEGVQQAGGMPVVLPFVSEQAEVNRLAGLCDGFLFTGGHDVSPELYHEQPLPGLVTQRSTVDRMEALFLEEAIRSGKPVLGICRGIQFINAQLGGDAVSGSSHTAIRPPLRTISTRRTMSPSTLWP